MKKKTYNAITLACTLQNDNEITNEKCLSGIISRTSEGFKFEEEIRKGRPPRNPKLYDGKFISMVKMQNGKYQCHLKTFNPTPELDKQELAFKVYSDLLNAFNFID